MGILQSESAYAIMPVGKKLWRSIVDERNEPPHRVTAQFGGSSLLFTVAKHPLGYLLSLWSLSSHLML